MFKHILVAVDGSPHADRALDEAIDLARMSEGTLTLVTVVPPLSGWFVARQQSLPPTANPTAGGPLPSDLARLHDSLVQEHRQILEQAEAKVPNGVPSTELLLEGRVGEAIVGQVRAGGHDLVAMGSRGRGELRSMVLGSVSHEVLHDSPVPVLIAHLRDDQLDRPLASS